MGEHKGGVVGDEAGVPGAGALYLRSVHVCGLGFVGVVRSSRAHCACGLCKRGVWAMGRACVAGCRRKRLGRATAAPGPLGRPSKRGQSQALGMFDVLSGAPCVL